MTVSTRPFLILYIAWHPAFEKGSVIAKDLYDHYRRDLYENLAGGAGLSVIYRSAPAPHTSAPPHIALEEGETAAIVLLFDEHFASDVAYVAWAQDLMSQTDAAGLGARVFPVAIDGALIKMDIMQQGVRWDRWHGMQHAERLLRLTSDLTYQFCRMLRSYLECLCHPGKDEAMLEQYLKKVQIFLSHSKRDPNGERIAKEIRNQLFQGPGLSSFFDVNDIPVGARFDDVILQQVRGSAVIAIYTDSFSSREWCRREIIEAKRRSVPLVVANCISAADERGFPYLGNVPVVRMDPAAVDRIDQVISRLLDEVLKHFLWQCRVKIIPNILLENTIFLPRPPELISLAALDGGGGKEIVLVYPDPPLGAEEQHLFEVIAPNILLQSLTEWLAKLEVTK